MQLTATTNADLAFRIGDFETLTDGLDYAAKGVTGCNFFSPRGQIAEVLSYADIRERARELAVRLSASGLKRGSRFGLIAETKADFVVFFYACQYAGLIPVPLPLSINLGGHESHVTRLRGMIAAAGLSAAMASSELLHTLREAADGLGVGLIGSPDHFYNHEPEGRRPAPLRQDRGVLSPVFVRKHDPAARRSRDPAGDHQQWTGDRPARSAIAAGRPRHVVAAALP